MSNIYSYQNITEVINLKQIKIACTGYILISIVFYITGFLCIVDPELIQLHSRTLAGTILIVYGIIKIIGYFSKDLYCLAFQHDFACGIFLIVLGITTLCISSRFKDSSLLAALGILILLDSLLSIQTALDSKKIRIILMEIYPYIFYDNWHFWSSRSFKKYNHICRLCTSGRRRYAALHCSAYCTITRLPLSK